MKQVAVSADYAMPGKKYAPEPSKYVCSRSESQSSNNKREAADRYL